MVAVLPSLPADLSAHAADKGKAGMGMSRDLPALPSRPSAPTMLHAPLSGPPGPPPPSDLPPLSPRQQKALASQAPVSPRASTPGYVPPEDLLPLQNVQKGTIEDTTRRCILAEAMQGFDLKTIGRMSPAYGGEKVYANLADYFTKQIADGEFSRTVDEVQQVILADPARHLKKLKKTTGSAAEATGQANSVDCDYGMKLLQPLFSLICGDRQVYEDCELPATVKSLFLSLDRNLVKAMLHWRKGRKLARSALNEEVDRLRSNKDNCDDKGNLKPAQLDELRKRYGWLVEFHAPLANSKDITASYIRECRLNFFKGILFTRCISPFLTPDKSIAAGSDAYNALTKTSAAANKIFAQDYKAFRESFIDYADRFLPEEEAAELRALESREKKEKDKEQWLEKARKAEKASGGSDKKLAPKPARASAPTLLQGTEFLALMEQEKALAKKDEGRDPFAASADSRAAQRRWIEEFRKKHADVFKAKPALDLAFSARLRKWRKKGEQLDEPAFREKLATLYKQASKDVERNAAASSTNAAPTIAGTGNAPQTILSPRASQAREKVDAELTPKKKVAKASKAMTALNDVQSKSVEEFLRGMRRRAYLERFPGLEAKLRQEFLAWCNEGTGGNPALALKKLFDALTVKFFLDATRLRQAVTDADLEKLEKACQAWPCKANEWKKPTPEEMSFLWHTKVCRKPAQIISGINVRMAEATIDQILSDPATQADLADHGLKNKFLQKAQSWLDSGATGMDPEGIIRGYYEDTLIKHFISRQDPALSASAIVALNSAAKNAGRSDPGKTLTTATLRALLQTPQDPATQS